MIEAFVTSMLVEEKLNRRQEVLLQRARGAEVHDEACTYTPALASMSS